MSQYSERELKETNKIKDKPIPKPVIGGSHLPEEPRTELNVAESFDYNKNDTIQKKLHVLHKPQSIKKINYAEHCTPRDNRKDKRRKTRKSAEKTERLKVQPFSFIKRCEDLKRQKEEKYNQFIENEKKLAMSFIAQPLLVAERKRMQVIFPKETSCTTSENIENDVTFEAKPATVLFKDTFKPYNGVRPRVRQTMLFQLARKAAERKNYEYEAEIQQKEEENERLARELSWENFIKLSRAM